MTRATSRYALVAGLLLTLAVLGLDVAGPRATVPETLRTAGAALTGPVLTKLSDTFPAPPESRFDVTAAQTELAATAEDLRTARASDALLNAVDVRTLRESNHRIVLARIIALGDLGPAGPERLTINVGSDDGVELDQTIVAATWPTIDAHTADKATANTPTATDPAPTTVGLVGRTVRVGATTSDVLILGAADLVVGARGADSDLLGTVSPPRAGSAEPRMPGQLTFAAISFGELVVGETLRTVGSPGERPFVPGITIGTVIGVDPSRGRVGTTAAVQPAVDVGRLDVVAVIATGDG